MRFCSLFSGSSGNSLYVETDKTKVLIDAGLSGKRISEALGEMQVLGNDISAILITHDHSDHIRGAGILSRRYNIPIYANQGTWNEMIDKIGKLKEENIKVFNSEDPFYINDIQVKSFKIPHDAKEPVGFSMYKGDKKISVATDIGKMNEQVISNIEGSDLVILESNHDIEMLKSGRYPYYLKRRILGDKGHLSNEDAGKTIVELVKKGLDKVILGHLSQENNFPELAYQSVINILEENSMIPNKDVHIKVASRHERTPIYNI